VNGVHLLVSDVALLVGFIHLGAPEDHEVALSLGELVVFLLGIVRRVTSLWGKLLGLALLAEGATDVNLHGRAVLEEMLWLPPVEGAGGLECLIEVLRVCATPTGLRSSSTVGRGHHLLPTALPVLVLLTTASRGRGRIITTVATTEVAGDLGFPAEVGLDCLLTGDVLGGDV
jgi:hypothetical protein